MKKLISSILILSTILLCFPIISYAYTASNVPSYLFDANYYSAKYYDLGVAFGTNKTKLYNHWNTYGKKEGRSPSPVYDANYYVNNNPDLKAAFGNNYSKLYEHFVTYGINEFRKSSPLYDGNYYKTHYSDLQNAFGSNSKSYLQHFMTYGMKEGRQASEDFNAWDYKSRYDDLQKAYGDSMKDYFYHYMLYGINENRNAKPSGNISPTAVPDTTTSNAANARNAWVQTSSGRLNMRQTASTSSKIVGKIPNGSQITIYGNVNNNFYKATYSGQTGYVSASYITFTAPNTSTNANNTPTSSTGLINSNLSKVSLIKQGSKTCKASAVAQSLNIIVGSSKYTTNSLGGSSCTNINGKTYKGSDGNLYVATYKQDSYVGSTSEQLSKINDALLAGLPIVVTVHKTTSGTKHHWVTIIGKSGNNYEIIDPATGTKRTMSNANYAFGLADYTNGYHYGYVCFTKK